jgi:sortase (surface protein transpeptidase)
VKPRRFWPELAGLGLLALLAARRPADQPLESALGSDPAPARRRLPVMRLAVAVLGAVLLVAGAGLSLSYSNEAEETERSVIKAAAEGRQVFNDRMRSAKGVSIEESAPPTTQVAVTTTSLNLTPTTVQAQAAPVAAPAVEPEVAQPVQILAPPPTQPPPPQTTEWRTYQPSELVAQLTIARFGYDGFFWEGDETPNMTAPLKLGPAHLPETVMPGQVGNSVIVGHRLRNVFYFLDRLVPPSGDFAGDEIVVTYADGVSYVFRVTETHHLIPRQDPGRLDAADFLSAETPDGLPRLTLMTCYQPNANLRSDAERWVIVAVLDRVITTPAPY